MHFAKSYALRDDRLVLFLTFDWDFVNISIIDFKLVKMRFYKIYV